jgi:hypothetical protein
MRLCCALLLLLLLLLLLVLLLRAPATHRPPLSLSFLVVMSGA